MFTALLLCNRTDVVVLTLIGVVNMVEVRGQIASKTQKGEDKMNHPYFRLALLGYQKKDVEEHLSALEQRMQNKQETIVELRRKLQDLEYENEDLMSTLLVHQQMLAMKNNSF